MFSASNIKKYEEVANVHTETLAKTLSAEAFLLCLLKNYNKKWGMKSHKNLAKSLISLLESKSVDNAHLDNAFKKISQYIQSNHLSIRGDFFSLLLAFFRHHPGLIQKVKPDTQGIYALLLLGIFAYSNLFYNVERDGLIIIDEVVKDFETDKVWMKTFIKEMIPLLSKPLLKEFVDGCIADNFNPLRISFYDELKTDHQVPILKLLIESKALSTHLHKKVWDTLAKCTKNNLKDRYILFSDKPYSYHRYISFPNETYSHQGDIIGSNADLLCNVLYHISIRQSYFKINFDLLSGNRYQFYNIHPSAIPLFFQILSKETQKWLLTKLLEGYVSTKHHFNILDALMIIQRLFPEHEKQISDSIDIEAEKEMKSYRTRPRDLSIFEYHPRIPQIAKINGERALFAMEKQKYARCCGPVIAESTRLPSVLIPFIIDYCQVDSIEKYTLAANIAAQLEEYIAFEKKNDTHFEEEECSALAILSLFKPVKKEESLSKTSFLESDVALRSRKHD